MLIQNMQVEISYARNSPRVRTRDFLQRSKVIVLVKDWLKLFVGKVWKTWKTINLNKSTRRIYSKTCTVN